jgi:threonine/homoserine/homoserine lactone efflux protein
VSTGDVIWPLAAIFGLVALVNSFDGAMLLMRFGGAAILIWMGLSLMRSTGQIETSRTLSESGWAGYLAGLGVIFGNPKAVLFYLGVLPAIFDIAALRPLDMVAICLTSATVPFLGNMLWALAASRAGRLLKSPVAIRRLDQVSGGALIAVGAVIALS